MRGKSSVVHGDDLRHLGRGTCFLEPGRFAGLTRSAACEAAGRRAPPQAGDMFLGGGSHAVPRDRDASSKLPERSSARDGRSWTCASGRGQRRAIRSSIRRARDRNPSGRRRARSAAPVGRMVRSTRARPACRRGAPIVRCNSFTKNHRCCSHPLALQEHPVLRPLLRYGQQLQRQDHDDRHYRSTSSAWSSPCRWVRSGQRRLDRWLRCFHQEGEQPLGRRTSGYDQVPSRVLPSAHLYW